MNVMLADIETDALAGRRQKPAASSRPTCAASSATSPIADSVERAAQAAFEAFGNVHVVCNNAGVAAGGGIDHISLDNWRWVIDVNLMGVLHGISSFLPHIRGHGEGGHIVNTASMAGMRRRTGIQPLRRRPNSRWSGCRKGLAMQLKPHGIGVSVLCPSFVRTRIGESGRNRPERYGQTQPLDPASPAAAMVAEIAKADRGRARSRLPSPRACSPRSANDELYIFTHPDMRSEVEGRFAAILAAMDKVTAPCKSPSRARPL